jgi:hypothetical protein
MDTTDLNIVFKNNVCNYCIEAENDISYVCKKLDFSRKEFINLIKCKPVSHSSFANSAMF